MLTSVQSYSPHLASQLDTQDRKTTTMNNNSDPNTEQDSLLNQRQHQSFVSKQKDRNSSSKNFHSQQQLEEPSLGKSTLTTVQDLVSQHQNNNQSQPFNSLEESTTQTTAEPVEPFLFNKTLHQQEEATSEFELQQIKDRLHQVMNMSSKVLQRSMLGDPLLEKENEFLKQLGGEEDDLDDEEDEQVEEYHSDGDIEEETELDESSKKKRTKAIMNPMYDEDNSSMNGETKGEFDENQRRNSNHHLDKPRISSSFQRKSHHYLDSGHDEFRSSSTQPSSFLRNSTSMIRSTPPSRDQMDLEEEEEEDQESTNQSPKSTLSHHTKSHFVTKEDTEPKHYYRLATMSTGMVFMINSFMLYFGGQGKIQVGELYGFNNDSPHLQRTVAILFFVMGVINLAPNLFGGEDGFSLRNAAEYFPFLIAVLNVVVATHYVAENFRHQGETMNLNWVSLCGLVLFIVLNIKLATLSHPGAKVKVKRSEYQQMKFLSNKNQ
ncbi:hypothetical protein C9374_014661 [Naegleria lovaniensis]|uniref:Uncharacterized protein n=1 Tax=Naegleria lovaniensis TaxID=51637 RepID=A0AA88KQ31_NAELO|nr:uncharacterized protein C9374_014661 [Naegleria lovaniensis]KAG2389261.1 hypothetical protein C9374_014661 [Naegleria lovaniensis]